MESTSTPTKPQQPKVDILTVLSKLSNDEVFTPPSIANDMLDLLPKDLWHNKEARFLDPFTKSGVFLREITLRLLDGLADQIPDKQERLDHILKKQVFGVAISELTAMLARRSLYGNKAANHPTLSLTGVFDDDAGNIILPDTAHTWDKKGNCRYCGVSKAVWDRGDANEKYAYPFLHSDHPDKDFFPDMKFDVIIGNPPYQMSDGGDNSIETRQRGGATPLYDQFVDNSIKLKPTYLSMIIPSRWFTQGRGVEEFRSKMLNDVRIAKIYDFVDGSDCFGSQQVKGGICYFLWDINKTNRDVEFVINSHGAISKTIRPLVVSEDDDVFVRFNEAVSILKKVKSFAESSFYEIVSAQKPFGLRTFYKGLVEKKANTFMVYANKSIYYIDENDIVQNKHLVFKSKVFISSAYGAGEGYPHQIINRPFYGSPGTLCTETYLLIGPFETENEAQNCIFYLKSKFCRFLIMLRKQTQHASRNVYKFVPMQDFSTRLSDDELYKKYCLSEEEIAFIESMIRPMD